MPTTTAHGPLTPKGIERLKPRAERYHVNDSNFPGLQLRVTPNGVKSFRWAVRDSAGKQRWITIGQWALHAKPKHVTLSEAHRWLERLKEARDMGQLDQAEAELRAATAPPSPAEKSNGTTVEDVAIAFWKVLDQQRKRGSGEAKAIYEKHIKEMIGPVALQDLKRSQCSAVVERAYNNGAPIHSAKVLGLMKQMLDFAERRIADDEFMNPAARLKPKDFGIRGNRRKRWLSEAELPVFWRALDRADDETPESAADRQKMAAALRLLLLLSLIHI